MNIKKLTIRLNGEPVKQKTVEETEDLTLRDAFTSYIWDCRKNKTYAEPTIDGYEIIRDKHLQYIIDDNIFGLDEHKVQVALDNEIAKGLSVNTVRRYKAVLLKIFEFYRPDFKPNLVVKKEV